MFFALGTELKPRGLPDDHLLETDPSKEAMRGTVAPIGPGEASGRRCLEGPLRLGTGSLVASTLEATWQMSESEV
jgi:hypothetical protein